MAAYRDVEFPVMRHSGSFRVFGCGKKIVSQMPKPSIKGAIHARLQFTMFTPAAQIMHLERVQLIVIQKPGTPDGPDVGMAFGAQTAILGETITPRFGNRHREIHERRSISRRR